MRGFLISLAMLTLAACEPVVMSVPGPATQTSPNPDTIARSEIDRAARQFVDVVETVEPVAEAECRRLAVGRNCDFLIVIDDRPGQEPNAFQTVDRRGRPILAFNIPLIASVRNADELAFVMGHEAAHHVLSHLEQTADNASVGAVIFSGIAAMSGATEAGVREAERIGAEVGARRYSKDFELEADRLGTIITSRAGFDPIRGAAFFTRIPDPGNRFLGTHPPNAARMAIVRRTIAGL